MKLLLWVAYLNALTLGSSLGLKVGSGVQILGGRSQSPFYAGPNGVPLLNAPVTDQPQTTYNLIVSPAAAARGKVRGAQFELGYTPRLYFDMTQFSNDPRVFHILAGKIVLGKPQGWLVTIAPLISVGGLSFGAGAGAPATTFQGAARPGTQSSSSLSSDYLSANVSVRIERPFGRDYKFVTTEALGLMQAGDTSQRADVAGALAPAGFGAQSLRRADTINEFHVRIDSEHEFIVGGQALWVSFPATQSYAGLIATVGYDFKLDKYNDMKLRGGAMTYRTGPFPNQYSEQDNLPVGLVSLQHSFAGWGLPRLKGGLALSEDPYFDIIYGDLQPRGSATADLAYDVTHHLLATVQARAYTQAMFGHTIAGGRDKYVATASTQLKYRYTKWFGLSAGVFGIHRSLVPSTTDPIASTEEIFFFVGAEAAYDSE